MWKWIERRKNDAIAKRVKECFDGVDWTKQTFTAGGAVIKTPKGDEHFYPCREVDAAIDRLNAVLADLQS